MWQKKLKMLWKTKDVRNKVLYVLGLLVIYRMVAHIPIPGVNVENLRRLFESNELLGLLNLFSGGGMQNFSIIMVGVAPYITASIILQLLTYVVPKFEELSKEGEYGRQKINQYTRWLTVPLAALQTYGMISLLNQGGFNLINDTSAANMALIILTVTAGSMFLVWIGDLISEKKIGNGISVLIFAGIISSFPGLVQRMIATYDPAQLFTYLGFAVSALLTIVVIVFVTEGQRNIPVSYGRQARGGSLYGGAHSHLPLRVNMAGVIPIIFAISLVLFPPIVAQLFLRAKSLWIINAAQWVIDTFQNQWFYGIFYFVLVVGFTYFYTAIIFHPDQVAENLQKQGGFIPGIRPGKATSDYLSFVMNRIVLVSALFLGAIAVLPIAMQAVTGTSLLAIGGTSLLIVVAVVMDTINQINAQLQMRDYEAS